MPSIPTIFFAAVIIVDLNTTALANNDIPQLGVVSFLNEIKAFQVKRTLFLLGSAQHLTEQVLSIECTVAPNPHALFRV